MVKQTAESQFRCRTRKALAEGRVLNARGDANRLILEELKKEISEGSERVEASSGSPVEKQEGWVSVVREESLSASAVALQVPRARGYPAGATSPQHRHSCARICVCVCVCVCASVCVYWSSGVLIRWPTG